MDYSELIRQNRMQAFLHYVKDWKKQDVSTVKVEGDIYSYRTKRGIKHRFRATRNVTTLKVQGFYFEELK